MIFMEEALELDARRKIYECISKSQGLHFREIQRRVDIATGSLDYHLHFLCKTGLIRLEKEGKFTRYYALTKNWSIEEKKMLNLLRQKTIRHIVIILLQKKELKASEISSELQISAANLSWYLNHLSENKMVSFRKSGRFRYYSLTEREKAIRCLVAHKKSFLDDMVDRFIDAWAE